MQSNGHWEGDFAARTKAGRRFQAHVRNAVIKDGKGDVTGFVGISVNTSPVALIST